MEGKYEISDHFGESKDKCTTLCVFVCYFCAVTWLERLSRGHLHDSYWHQFCLPFAITGLACISTRHRTVRRLGLSYLGNWVGWGKIASINLPGYKIGYNRLRLFAYVIEIEEIGPVIMASDIQEFIQSPSEDLLDTLSRDQLLELASHYEIGLTVHDKRLKGNIKDIMKSALWDEGVFKSSAIPTAKEASLTFEQQKELLLIQIEAEQTNPVAKAGA